MSQSHLDNNDLPPHQSLKQSLLDLDNFQQRFEKNHRVSEDYDPARKPANIELAKKHGKAKRIYKFEEIDESEGRLCPCCGLPEEGGKLLPLACDPSELYHIGSGYVLYFIFFKHCIGLLVTILMISGLYNMYTNYVSKDCADPTTIGIITEDLCCTQNLVSDLSLASKKDHPDQRAFQIQLNLLTIIALIIYCQSLRYKVRKMNEEVAETKVSPADYTVMFTEMPTDSHHELSKDEGLKKWLEAMGTPENPIQVKKINRSYDVEEFLRCAHKQEKLDLKKKSGEISIHQAETQYRQLDEKMEQMESEGFKRTGIIFVSFKDDNQAKFVRKLFKKNILQELLFKAKRIFYLLYWGELSFNKDNIEAKKGPEPTDIEWQNLSYHIGSKLRRRFVIFFIMMTIIAIDFFIILQINIQFKQLAFVPSAQYAYVGNQFLNYLSSVIIVGLDVILEKICLYLNGWEMHYAKSNFSKGAATRIGFYTSLNLIVPILMANIGNAFIDSLYPTLTGQKASVSIPWAIYGDSGMIQTMVFVFWFEAIKNWGMNLFDPFYYLKVAQQKKAIFTKGKGITQAEAHEIFEGPGADMERRHGGLVAALILTTFYAPALPIALLFTLVSLLANYWSDKYIFLRRMVLPGAIGPQITMRSLNDVEYIILIFAAGNVFFSYNIQSKVESQVLNIVTDYSFRIIIVIAIVYKFILPVDWLNQVLFPVKKRDVYKGDYDRVRSKFLTDYDIENPVTRAKALEELKAKNESRKSMISSKKQSRASFTELKLIKKSSRGSYDQESLL